MTIVASGIPWVVFSLAQVRGYSSDAEKQQASSASRLIRTLTKADDGTCSKVWSHQYQCVST